MSLTDLIARIAGRKSPATGRPFATGVTRRELAGAATAALLMPGVASGSLPEVDPAMLGTLDRAQLAAMVRGLANLQASGDGEIARQADALLQRIARVMPEAPVLLDLHLLFGSGRSATVCRPHSRVDMSALHRACHEARPVSFDYVDLQGNATSRRVLPLELVHPAHGILLLAWCELRQAHRKFFAHSMENLRVHAGDFSDRRLALLQAALNEETARREQRYDD